MTINPITQSKTSIETSALQINSLNAQNLANFYQDVIGLTLIEATDTYYALGTKDQKVLLEIFATTTQEAVKSTGLYHMAFLLPTKADLGTILRFFIDNQVPLEGASNHGYSNALYLSDPEGNGIEIYWDKDQSEWDIKDDGQIAGIVEPMDAEDVLSVARPKFDGMPNGTTMGHLHLHVGNLDDTLSFYVDIMGLGFKYPMGGQAAFMASGDYHHHLGANLWKGTNLPAPVSIDQAGLRASIWTANQKDFDFIVKNLTDHKIDFDQNETSLTFNDNSGLRVIVNLVK